MYTRTSRSFNDAYPQLVWACMGSGAVVGATHAESGASTETTELHPAIIEVVVPEERLVTAVGRPVNVAFALAEVVWILNGGRDVETIAPFNETIRQWSDDGQIFNAAYGYRMRDAHGYDQIEDALRTLRADRDSRQAVITIWHPDDRGWDLLPSHNGGVGDNWYGRRQTKDRACNLVAHPMVRKGGLDWMQVMRSNDALWGVPYNWMQWTHVQEYVARSLGVRMGYYTHVADSLHIYARQYAEARRIEPFSLYNVLGVQHAAMQVDAAGHTLPAVLAALRDHQPPRHPVGSYWESVLAVLAAHRAYKAGSDLTALHMLHNCGDAVYGAAQMRFYYHHRWSKNQDLAGDISLQISRWYPRTVHEWITHQDATVAPSEDEATV